MKENELREIIFEFFSLIENRFESRESNLENIRENDFATKIEKQILEDIEGFFSNREQVFDIQLEENLENFDRPDSPDYTVILDSMDGSHHLIEGEGSFGPIIGIADCEDPNFDDVIGSGFLNLNSSKKYFAIKGEGCYKISNDSRETIETSEKENIETGINTKILLQQGFLANYPEIAEHAWRHWCNDYGSQGQHFAMIADGRRDLFISGGHSKLEAKPVNSPEELAGMYLILKEAGGAVTDWNGKTIAENKIGMRKNHNHDIIAASSEEIAVNASIKLIPDKYKAEQSKGK